MHCKTSIDFGYLALPGEWIKFINLTCYYVLFRFRSFIQNPTNVRNTRTTYERAVFYFMIFGMSEIWITILRLRINSISYWILTDMKIKPQFVKIIYIFEVTGTPDIHPANTTTFVAFVVTNLRDQFRSSRIIATGTCMVVTHTGCVLNGEEVIITL